MLKAIKILATAIAPLVVVGAMTLGAATEGPKHERAARFRSAKAVLTNVDGEVLGVARFTRTYDGKTMVRLRASNLEPAGSFLGFHVHQSGVCDPSGETPFASAGGHFNPTSEDHGAHAGDMPVLLVDSGGEAWARFVTDRFSLRDLFDSDGSAVIIHARPDNYANVPDETPEGEERYHSHVEDVFGPDSATLSTGDAGSRFACGVVR